MKSVLKIMNQPLRAITQKTAVHTINSSTWETSMKEPTPTKTADIVPAALLEMDPTTGIPQEYIKQNDYFKENPWMTASKYTIYIKSLKNIYKICAYLQVQTLL